MRSRVHLALLVATLLMHAACGESYTVHTFGSCSFSDVSGNRQTGQPGAPLAEPLEVGALGEFVLCVLPDTAQIDWRIESGGGSVTPVPDAKGRKAMWTLGPGTGIQSVRATWSNAVYVSPNFVIFTATAQATP